MAWRVIGFIDGAYGRDRTARQGDAMTPRDAACPTETGSLARPQLAEVDERIARCPALEESVDRWPQVERADVGGREQLVAADGGSLGRDVRELVVGHVAVE